MKRALLILAAVVAILVPAATLGSSSHSVTYAPAVTSRAVSPALTIGSTVTTWDGAVWTWDYMPDGTQGWLDDACEGSHDFRVILYRDTNYNSDHTMLCKWHGDFCMVPIAQLGYGGCTGLYGFPNGAHCGNYNFEDCASSLTMHAWYTLPTDKCVVVYGQGWYNGTHDRMHPNDWLITNLGSTAIGNDNASSVKVTTPDTCP